ncbi:MAG TPA: GH92 family glycosyl hydrolase [Pyrinomonadaceae bacterium]|jgi:predicted alpha-1,2-mannosidase
MMFRRFFALALAVMLASVNLLGAVASPPGGARAAVLSSTAQRFNPAQYVNPFIGTANAPFKDYLGGNGSGNTFPGATMPFGMIQWSPDTEKGFGKDERGSYLYADTAIRGFSLTHLSGPGCPVFGDVPFMPIVGQVRVSPASEPDAYLAKFSHAKEKASPGYYEVALETGVEVKLSVTERTGLGTFTYPSSTDATMLVNAGRNATGVTDAEVELTSDRQLSGSVTSGGFCGTRNKYRLYFVAEFDRPFKATGIWEESKLVPGSRRVKGARTGAYVTFDTTADRDLGMRVGISYVSTRNALANLRAENPGWDVEEARGRAQAGWNEALGRIEVSGGTTAEKQVFYTALYHTLLHPNLFSDANGEYIGFDDRLHKARGYRHYTNFSGWDIYRSESPLIAFLFPKEASDMAQSLVGDAEQGGGLPIWPVANDESGAMYGDPAVPIIASTYALGARDFDTRAALRAMIKGATDPETKSKTYPERPGLADFLKYGYIPMEQKGLRGSPSVALEYEIADFSLAQFARAHGDMETYAAMMRRAQWWTKIFDPERRYIRGRWADGSWLPGFDFKAMLYDKNLPWRPESHKSYVEGNAVQYTWMIPHNMRALFDRIGGNEAVIKRLDSFFTELNAGPDRPYFFIGNEPVFAVPWAYNYAGQPWKTQAITRRALLELFTATPGGIPGNDDLGATSAWIVFAAMGLYPIIPGVGGFSINSPLFPAITVRLKDGRRLKITGEGATARAPYVQELRLNGKPYDSTWLPYEVIAKGATLQFKLGSTPNTRWATAPSAAPPSFNDGMESEPEPSR